MLISIQQNENIKKDTEPVENVAKFKYLGMILTKQTACTKKANAYEIWEMLASVYFVVPFGT